MKHSSVDGAKIETFFVSSIRLISFSFVLAKKQPSSQELFLQLHFQALSFLTNKS